MNHSIHLLTIAAVTTLWQASTFAAQTWTYQFTPTTTQPYWVSCGECGPPYAGSNADVAGTFTILLNWESGIGKILELNDHLVNVVDVLYTGTGTTSVPANPSTWEYGIVPPSHHSKFLPGQLTYTNGLGHFASDGSIQFPNGSYATGLPYEVWFNPTAATLNMTVPIDDAFITVTGATAAFMSSAWSGDLNHDGRVDKRDYVLLRNSTGPQADYDAWRWSYGATYFGTGSSSVPEPSAYLLTLITTAALLLGRRRFKHTTPFI